MTTPAEAKRLVLDYLDAMEARDLQTAQAFLDDDFTMVFPGAKPMTSLTELIDWARDRYRFVKKTLATAEAFESNGALVVYTLGTLRGEWPDGTPFSDIRFVDRFEVNGTHIVRQDVWNDLAEVRNA